MDAPRFDAMTKAWTRLPRRRVLGGLVAGTLAPLLGLGGKDVNAISGACQRSSDCDPGQACVHHTCVLTCTDPLICLKGGPPTAARGARVGPFARRSPAGAGSAC